MERNVGRSILIITERYRPEKFLINDLIDAWVAMGYQVRVLTQVPSYPDDQLFPGFPNEFTHKEEDGVRVTRFRTVLGYKSSLAKKILNYASFMIKACWCVLCDAKEADTVFVYQTGPLSQAVPIIVAKLLFRRRTVIWTQDIWPDTVFAYGFPKQGAFAVCLKAFVRLVYLFADEVLVSSPGFIRRLLPYLHNGRSAQFVPQWVPAAFLKEVPHGLDLRTSGTRFIFTGNVGKVQALDKVIAAFDLVERGRATLFILGDGSMRAELEAQVRQRGVENVRFLGSVPQERVMAAIKDCDFSLISLTRDPLISMTIPAKFQAYLAAGRPLLAVCEGEVRSIVERARLGLWADPDDIESIRAAVERALHSTPEERATWARGMRELLDRDYAQERSVQELTKAIFA